MRLPPAHTKRSSHCDLAAVEVSGGVWMMTSWGGVHLVTAARKPCDSSMPLQVKMLHDNVDCLQPG